MKKLLQTPSQTVGPYFAYGLVPEQYLYDFKTIVADGSDGFETLPQVCISGKVFDGKGQAIPDALLELWQNDGEHAHFARCGTGTDPENRFFFKTPQPRSLGGQAPFLTLLVFMRGQLIHSFTRVYFPEETELNATDEVLNTVPTARRATLMARKNGSVYEFDIWMQGPNETVFFDF